MYMQKRTALGRERYTFPKGNCSCLVNQAINNGEIRGQVIECLYRPRFSRDLAPGTVKSR